MINKKDFINYLQNWKGSLGKTFEDDFVEIVLDIILKKIESFPTVENSDCEHCGYKIHLENIQKLNSCNDCRNKSKCPVVPEPGEPCRINCHMFESTTKIDKEIMEQIMKHFTKGE